LRITAVGQQFVHQLQRLPQAPTRPLGLRQRRQLGGTLMQLHRHGAQMLDACRQAFVVGKLGRRLPQGVDLGPLGVDPLGQERGSRLQQAFAHLGCQLQRMHIGDIGDQVGGVLEPQAVLHQARLPGLRDQFLKKLHEALGPDPLAKIGAVGVIGHLIAQGQVEEPAEGHVGLGSFHDLPVGQLVMKAQEQDFEHAHRVDGRPAHARAVRLGEPRAKALEVNVRRHLPQIMVLGHDGVEDLPIEFG
jgi:hypothetical protein